MSQVLNIKERNQAFTQFLVFFLVTTALIVGSIYFNFRVPVNENATLREKITLQQVDIYYQQKFLAQMVEASKYLDSLGKKDINLTVVDIQLAGKLADLEKLRQRDSSAYGKMNKAIVDAFLELQGAKKELIDLRKKADLLVETEKNLTNTQNRLEDYQKAYAQLNSQ